MATESDPTTMHVTVVLNKPEDWQAWIFLRKDVAQQHDLWQYCNPDVATADLPLLTEPVEPMAHQYKVTKVPGTIYADADLNDNEFRRYQFAYDRYEKQYTRYLKQKQALQNLNTDISTTIAKRHIYLLHNKDTPHARLVSLKKHLAPSTAVHRRDLIDNYRTSACVPRQSHTI
ncbi:hypothetical protein BU23DRAFT_494288 [Bimuria novae-zelandiae CBS 107.79]|uniref:Uncharacterized protein n=1 Tax=Bimuria novae-zelandiae CBS 107.79 TaxID=1447943 RepID=A0A6A5UJQ8_9PLEO|nr:hypothetical protein BU23DRAFT_494288 [Bimuria novae-zelandiae CBS 107.79]